MCCDVAGRRLAAWAICLTLDLALDPALSIFPPTASTSGHHFGFENSHTAFRGVLRHYV